MMRYILSDDAKEDLERIIKYLISKENKIANTFLKDLRESCKTLTKFPEIAPLVRDEIKTKSPYINNIRFWSMFKFKKYTIFYTKENSEIVIIRILHDRQNALMILDR